VFGQECTTMNRDELLKKQKAKRKNRRRKNVQQPMQNREGKATCFLGHLDPDIVFLVFITI